MLYLFISALPQNRIKAVDSNGDNVVRWSDHIQIWGLVKVNVWKEKNKARIQVRA